MEDIESTEPPTSLLLSLNTLSSQAKSSSNRSSLQSQLQDTLCPHCDQLLTAKTFRRHRNLYFNPEDGSWTKDTQEIDSDHSEGADARPPPLPELPDVENESDVLIFPSELETGTSYDIPSDSGSSSDEDHLAENNPEEFWEEDLVSDSDNENAPPPLPESVGTSSEIYRQQQSLATWFLGFLFRWQAKHFLPDAALHRLILFLYTFFLVLGRFSTFVAGLACQLPASIYRFRQMLKLNDHVSQYVVCPKCDQIYHRGSCIVLTAGKEESKKCQYREFPNHPQRARRQCSQLLMKTVHLRSNRTILYPFKTYCYHSIQSSLENFLLRPGFLDSCDHWKCRNAGGILQDVYDGRIWHKFLDVLDASTCTCLALTLNVDWFQPYEHTCASVGVIYLTILNLPCSVRYKRQNIFLVGVIPGPSEPSHDINSYLHPLVNELLLFWKGVQMKVCRASGVVSEQIRCILICVTCDIPAGRKVCGFLGHSAQLGCTKCLKPFPGSVGAMNYSGFNRSTWPPRNVESHRINIQRIQQCKTKHAQMVLESKLGCRYSVLMQLPYFDPIKMLAIDPMHNLFLGTAKRMLNQWLQLHLLPEGRLEVIQETVNNISVPSDVGRIPRKIATGFSGFTADQFKNWVTIYSIPTLYDILPSEHLECWRHFVLACRILCKKVLSNDDVKLADALLIHFCKRVERIYGELSITPNMHLHGHLCDVLQDFGPVHEFWLFSFERYNGILGNQPSNNRLIEPQLMKRFLRDNLAYFHAFPHEFETDFSSVCQFDDQRICGSTMDTMSPSTDHLYSLPTRSNRGTLCSVDQSMISVLYRRLHPELSNEVAIHVNSIFTKYSSIHIRGKRYNSSCEKATAPSIALVKWDNELFCDPPNILEETAHPDSSNRPVKIHYFAKVSLYL